MNTLNLRNINLHSPYLVGQTDENNTYELRDLYIIRTAEGLLDGIMNFTALFSRKDNPRLKELLAEFEETISIEFD